MQTPPNYRQQAEDLALQYYLNFSETERENFFAFFREIYSENNVVYQTLLTQHPTKAFSKQQKYYILLLILKCLPPAQQVMLLHLELLDAVGKYKQVAIRHYSLITLYDENIWYMYERYLKNLDEIDTHISQWFLAESYAEDGRKDVLQVVKYISYREVKYSMQNFQKDTDIIRDKGKYKLDKWVYEEDFFGKHIRINTYAIDLDFSLNDLDLPVLTSQYAPILQNHIIQSITKLEEKNAINEVQEALLAQDLEASMLHYKSTKSFLRQVDMSVQLRGSGGVVSAEIKPIFTQRDEVKVVTDVAKVFGMIIPALLFIVIGIPLILIGVIFFIAMTIYNILGVGILAGIFGLVWALYQLTKDYHNESVESYSTETMNDLSKEFKNFHIEVIREKRYGTPQLLIGKSVYDITLQNLWQEILQKSTPYKFTNKHPDIALSIYQICMKDIHKLKVKNIENSPLHLPKEVLLEAMQSVLKHKLRYSYHQFTKLIDEIMRHNLEAECFINLLDMECTLYKFYKADAKRRVWFRSVHQVYESLKKRIANFDKAVGNPPAINLLNGRELEDWMNTQIKKYHPRNFDKEFKQLQKQIKATSHAKEQDETMSMPIFYENEEIVLYIF